MTIYRDDLERVYALIEKPENWTQGAYARKANGDPVTFEDDSNAPLMDEAACWCLMGASIKCGIKGWASIEQPLGLSGKHVPDWNDTHTHAEVLDLLRAAIARAPERPQRGEGE